jgi:hypothetical protein
MIDISQYFPKGPVGVDFPFEFNGLHVILNRDFLYVDTLDGKDLFITVPAGFQSDFNSTPRFLWAYFPPQECPEAGIVHDYLYRHPGDLSRGDIDRIHRRIMELKGERKSKRAIAWAGIRSGGWKPWNQYRDAEQAAVRG